MLWLSQCCVVEYQDELRKMEFFCCGHGACVAGLNRSALLSLLDG